MPPRLHVVEQGTELGTGEGRLPILMLAEPPATCYLWRDVARYLESDYRSLLADLPGCGASESPPGRRSYALDAQAAALLRLLDARRLPRVALVASGVAGLVALQLAALAPDRVAALVMVGTVVHADSWPVAGVLPLLPIVSGEALMSRMRGDRGRFRVAALLSTNDGPDLERYLQPLRQPGGGRSLLRWLRSVDMELVTAARKLVAAAPPPTLVLWGADDQQLSLDYGRRVATDLGATWVPIADCGHLAARDRPERVAEEISAFLTDL